MQSVTMCKAVAAVSCRPSSSPRCTAPRRQAAPAAARRLRTAAVASVDTSSTAKYPAWEGIYNALVKAKLETISPEAAFDLAELGQAVVIDVRPSEDYQQAHAKGALSVPAFITIDTPSSPGEFGKWLACKANGVVPTKPNPQLLEDIKKAAAGGKAVILACEAGGTLEPSTSFPQGKVSRSLKAAWKVVFSGTLPVEQVKHLEGGVFQWYSAGLPMVGDYDPANAGRTPNVIGKGN